ncbi:MAG: ABC transporter permease, partial [Clostridia bacterium]|nr:ABC transporter permease [Clostridia bacterium]
HDFLTYASIIIAVIAAFVLKRTRVGLSLRAVGENPATADAAGINVTRFKYVATMIGSAIAGLGGLQYVMAYANGVWSNNAFGDRGWLAIALVIFSLWKPDMAILGSFLFGALCNANNYIQGLGTATQELFKLLPYVVTLVVLIITSMRKKREHQPPQALGLAYFREER